MSSEFQARRQRKHCIVRTFRSSTGHVPPSNLCPMYSCPEFNLWLLIPAREDKELVVSIANSFPTLENKNKNKQQQQSHSVLKKKFKTDTSSIPQLLPIIVCSRLRFELCYCKHITSQLHKDTWHSLRSPFIVPPHTLFIFSKALSPISGSLLLTYKALLRSHFLQEVCPGPAVSYCLSLPLPSFHLISLS